MPLYANSGLAQKGFIDAAGPLGEGVHVLSIGNICRMTRRRPSRSSSAIMAKNGFKPQGWGEILAANGYMTIKAALSKISGPVTGQAMRDTIETLCGFETMTHGQGLLQQGQPRRLGRRRDRAHDDPQRPVPLRREVVASGGHGRAMLEYIFRGLLERVGVRAARAAHDPVLHDRGDGRFRDRRLRAARRRRGHRDPRCRSASSPAWPAPSPRRCVMCVIYVLLKRTSKEGIRVALASFGLSLAISSIVLIVWGTKPFVRQTFTHRCSSSAACASIRRACINVAVVDRPGRRDVARAAAHASSAA